MLGALGPRPDRRRRPGPGVIAVISAFLPGLSAEGDQIRAVSGRKRWGKQSLAGTFLCFRSWWGEGYFLFLRWTLIRFSLSIHVRYQLCFERAALDQREAVSGGWSVAVTELVG